MSQEKLCPAAWHEHARIDRNPHSRELGPPNDLFEWDSGDPLLDHLFQLGRCFRTGQQ
jgi:hypothetical protein